MWLCSRFSRAKIRDMLAVLLFLNGTPNIGMSPAFSAFQNVRKTCLVQCQNLFFEHFLCIRQTIQVNGLLSEKTCLKACGYAEMLTLPKDFTPGIV